MKFEKVDDAYEKCVIAKGAFLEALRDFREVSKDYVGFPDPGPEFK